MDETRKGLQQLRSYHVRPRHLRSPHLDGKRTCQACQMRWNGDWSLLFKLMNQGLPMSASEVQDSECTEIAKRWLRESWGPWAPEYQADAPRGEITHSRSQDALFVAAVAGEINPSR